jgi:Protein of unknown function (DUF4232)
MRWALLIGLLAALAAPGCSSAATCGGLSGSFSVVPNSQGAGNILYTLRLKNGGSASCLLRGLPALRLLGAHGKPLPTHISLDPRYHARTFLLRPGRTATATARFTPDVPGPGETTVGACEPVAHTARVTAGGATVVVPLRPPTRVCVHGHLTFTTYH